MAENTADDLNLAAAQAAGHLLERCVPEHAAVLTPYVLRLFAALQNGHSFVWLDEGEAEELAGLRRRSGRVRRRWCCRAKSCFWGGCGSSSMIWRLKFSVWRQRKSSPWIG